MHCVLCLVVRALSCSRSLFLLCSSLSLSALLPGNAKPKTSVLEYRMKLINYLVDV
jgi:hypothetical protein